MLPPPIGLGVAAAALAGVIVGLRLLLRPTTGSPGLMSWTVLPGIVRGIRAWVRPRPRALPVSAGAARSENDQPPGEEPEGEAPGGNEAADPILTVEVESLSAGGRH